MDDFVAWPQALLPLARTQARAIDYACDGSDTWRYRRVTSVTGKCVDGRHSECRTETLGSKHWSRFGARYGRTRIISFAVSWIGGGIAGAFSFQAGPGR